MYESPIEVIQKDVQDWFEDNVVKACQKVDINVNRDRLIKALQFDRNQYNAGYADGYNVSRWIPVSDHLPEEDTLVLTTATIQYFPRIIVPYLMSYHIDHWILDTGDRFHGKVLAWQPLPELYEEEEQ